MARQYLGPNTRNSGRATALILVFVLGIVAAFGGHVGLEYTNSLEFCSSCHSMQTNLEEYKKSTHYKNASGVSAICSDCHVPKEFIPKMQAKFHAWKDVFHEIIGTIDTRNEFEARRWKLANRVWDRMKATDSRECRSCHNENNMDLAQQQKIAGIRHTKMQAEGKTCIDCHKGVAHEEPDEPMDPSPETSG